MDPRHPDAFYQIGRIEETDGEYGKAEKAYRDQIAVNADHFGARLQLGVVLKLLNRTEQAIDRTAVRDPNAEPASAPGRCWNWRTSTRGGGTLTGRRPRSKPIFRCWSRRSNDSTTT